MTVGEERANSSLDLKVVGEVRPHDPTAWEPNSFSEWEAREQSHGVHPGLEHPNGSGTRDACVLCQINLWTDFL